MVYDFYDFLTEGENIFLEDDELLTENVKKDIVSELKDIDPKKLTPAKVKETYEKIKKIENKEDKKRSLKQFIGVIVTMIVGTGVSLSNTNLGFTVSVLGGVISSLFGINYTYGEAVGIYKDLKRVQNSLEKKLKKAEKDEDTAAIKEINKSMANLDKVMKECRSKMSEVQRKQIEAEEKK